MDWELGTRGDDVLTTGNADTAFGVWQGGEDSVTGGDGNDLINFVDKFNAGDTVDGGNGIDTLRLAGDYSDGVTMTATTLVNVENIQLGVGHDYYLTSNDATVAAGATLTVNAEALGAGDTVTFDGSAETDGAFRFIGGLGANAFTGGAGNDHFYLTKGGDAAVHGGGGNDTFYMGDTLDGSDAIDGGAGNDVVDITGNGDGNPDALVLVATSFTSVETLRLENFAVYDITTVDANVASGAWLTVDGTRIGNRSLTFDGSAETDGHFHIIAAGGDDVITGGALNDIIDLSRGGDGFDGSDTVTGGGGADHIIAGYANGSVDTFIYNAASDSTGADYDVIRNVDFSADVFTVPWGNIGPVTVVGGGSISHASFVADVTALGASLGVHGAQEFTATSGDLAGHSFLIIDVNGTVGYQSGQDIVIDVTGFSNLSI
ncbi:MAG TPA: calcium-binding protein [Rhizomicrobium sp.]|jgi:Ca2+-binding RTX toxin-like protein|nr:calcium-binding protein [Rhizomicrobium sp.]